MYNKKITVASFQLFSLSACKMLILADISQQPLS